MDKKFVFISVTTQTRDVLREIAKEWDSNIYKVVRNLAKKEHEKILKENNASVRKKSEKNKNYQEERV